MRNFNQDDIKAIDQNFDDYKKNLYPTYLEVTLKHAKKNFKGRKPHIIAMKRKDKWSDEDSRNTFPYNQHNFKLIREQTILIRYFESFIEFTEQSDREAEIKNERVMFSRDCIMKLHRIIAIYKATIISA